MSLTKRVVDFLEGRRKLITILYALAIVPSVWLGARMPLDLDLLSLLPSDIDAIRTVRRMEEWQGKIGFLYVGLVRDEKTDVDALKHYGDEVATLVAKSPWVKRSNAAIDLSKLVVNAPLYLEPDDLGLVGERMKAIVKTEMKKQSGLYVDLGDEGDEEEGPGFDDLIAKYSRRFQTDAPKKDAPQGAGASSISKVRNKLSATGGRFYYLSPDEKMLVFPIEPTFPVTDLEHFPELMTDVENALKSATSAVPTSEHLARYVGGAYALQYDMRDATLADFRRSTAFSLVLIFFITWFAVRRLRAVFMVFSSLLVGLALSAGAAAIVVQHVNVITVFLLAILGDLGVDFGMYFATRCDSLLDTGLRRGAAVREAWAQTAIPAATGALTMMCVFVLLAFGQFQGFAEMGRISAMGVALTWLVMYSLLPVLFLFFGRERLELPEPTLEHARHLVAEEDKDDAAGAPVSRFSPAGKLAGVYLAIAVVVSFLAAWSATHVRFGISGKELSVEGQKSLEIDEKIQEHYGEAIDYTVVLAEDEARAREIAAYFEAHYGESTNIARYESAFTYLPPLASQQAAMDRLDDWKWAIERLPKNADDPEKKFLFSKLADMKDPHPITVADLPHEIDSRFIGRDANGQVKGYLGYIVPRKWLWDIDVLNAFVDEIEKIEIGGKPVVMTGRAQIFRKVIEVVQREALLFSIVGLVLIFLVLLAQARSAKLVILSMLPLFVGTLWMLGTLPFIGPKGLDLSFMNLIVFPILVGLGVSYGVQIIYNYRIYGSASKALRVLLMPILGSSTTTLAGWTVLVPASMIGLQGIGWIATLGMVWITLFSLVGLPALLAWLEKRGWLKADRVMK